MFSLTLKENCRYKAKSHGVRLTLFPFGSTKGRPRSSIHEPCDGSPEQATAPIKHQFAPTPLTCFLSPALESRGRSRRNSVRVTLRRQTSFSFCKQSPSNAMDFVISIYVAFKSRITTLFF